MMRRDIDHSLIEWKESKQRKALLLRGARQVGKTFSVRILGQSFKYFLEVNFEEDRAVKKIFEGSLDPFHLSEKLSAYFSVPIISGQTLLFFDEVQACPNALSSLRFFYEKMPDLHIAAAGSLLEMVLSKLPSYGVGRIQSLFRYPMSFDEYLGALGENVLVDMKNSKEVEPVFHDKIINYLKIFHLIGGLPEIVGEYVRAKNILNCQQKLGDLLESFRDDFTKYKKRVDIQVLNEVFTSIAVQAGHKFKYSNVDSAHNHRASPIRAGWCPRRGPADPEPRPRDPPAAEASAPLPSTPPGSRRHAPVRSAQSFPPRLCPAFCLPANSC